MTQIDYDDSKKDLLRDFAKQHGAEYYKQWNNFEAVIKAALRPESKTIIYFNLEGIRDPARWAAEVTDLTSPIGQDFTAWELALINAAPPEVRKRVRWENGPNPLEW